MGFFSKKNEGGILDVIRCDEEEYLLWKWRPSAGSSRTDRENAIRWGSSLRVKDGEVAVFVYKQEDGPTQDYIEGPFDQTIETANFPVISNLIGMAYAGKSPFQAEIYFINLAGNLKVNFRTPYFDVFDPRFSDFPVRMVAGGSYTINITDYKGFIKLHRLIQFDMHEFSDGVRDAILKYVKGIVSNAPSELGIPVLQLERKILELGELINSRLQSVFKGDFGVNLKRFDLSTLEVDKETEEYRQLRQVTADLEIAMRVKQNEVAMQNLENVQQINALNMDETLRIQREQAERFAALQTQQQFMGVHQMNLQADVLGKAAENLGSMGNMDGSGSGGFNPAGMMAGMAIGGAMGTQMAGMVGSVGQTLTQSGMTPPPIPQSQYHVSVDGQNTGPFSMTELPELVRRGQLNPHTYIWKAGMTGWEHAGKVVELAALFAPMAPPPSPPPFAPPEA
jgi:membrane protease subunit (stomatin/prohibitin family)